VRKVAEPVASVAQSRRERLVDLYKEASVCTLCPLAETRTKVVFGAGDADADLMFIGEAPGAEEDRQGLPFVGRAGSILTGLLEEIGLRREDVWITNVLRCRPPGNRDPQPVEVESCHPYTQAQIELIRPRVIGTLGNFATRLITESRAPISKVRGTPQLRNLAGVTLFVMPLFHPAAALRTPALLETLREDFRALPDLLAQPAPEGAAREAATAAALAGAGTPEPDGDQLDLFG
jgi:uracil-DNA glycosylase